MSGQKDEEVTPAVFEAVVRSEFEKHFGHPLRHPETGEYLNEIEQAKWVGWLSCAQFCFELGEAE